MRLNILGDSGLHLMRQLLLALCLSAPAWCESMGKQVAQGTLIALGVLVGGAGGMWLLFWFVEKMGGRGRMEFTPHNVEDVGPIDRTKNHAFAAQERENMRKETPNWNAHVHDAFDSVQFGDTNPLDNI